MAVALDPAFEGALYKPTNEVLRFHATDIPDAATYLTRAVTANPQRRQHAQRSLLSSGAPGYNSPYVGNISCIPCSQVTRRAPAA